MAAMINKAVLAKEQMHASLTGCKSSTMVGEYEALGQDAGVWRVFRVDHRLRERFWVEVALKPS
jgi:hypothetical protein